jgi:hypothetical protein
MSSVVERRLLVNYRVDPEVAASLLPTPLRPRLVNGWAVAGICLIRRGRLRPSWAPGWSGMRTENAAHRVAVEWDGIGGRQRGVYIPRRDSDSAVTVLAGGRLFPGEHHRASFDVRETAKELHVAFASTDRTAHVSVDTRVWHSDCREARCSLTCGRHRISSGVARRDSQPPEIAAGSTGWKCGLTAGSSSRPRWAPCAQASSTMGACSRPAARPSTALC